MDSITPAERAAVADIRSRLITVFPTAAPGEVESAVEQAYARFDRCRVRDFVPLFVERRARKALEQSDTKS